MDGTLIETKSGKSWTPSITDWQLKKGVEKRLKALVDDGAFVFIVTNQLVSKKVTVPNLKQKMSSIIRRLNLSCC